MYHQVGEPAPRGTPYRGLTVSTARFRQQMVWLKRLGYTGLAMRDVMPYVRGEREGKVVGLTFDDGFQNVFDHAKPVLDALGFTATNYLLPDLLGTSNVWDEAAGVPASPLMNVDQMRAWAAAGHEIGSHTLDHADLNTVTDEEAVRQIAQSRHELEALAQVCVTAFCYPYGHHSPAHRHMAKQAGYTNATLTSRGRACAADDPFALPRITVARSTHLLQFLQKCLTGYEDRRRRPVK